jgi:hypothetical protein
MEVRKQEQDGLEVIQVIDLANDAMEVVATSEVISFEIDGKWCDFGKDVIRELIPHLAAWCDTGSLEMQE